MRIGFDLDWTLTTWPVPPWVFACQLLGEEWTGPPPDKYGLRVFNDPTADMLLRLFKSDYYMNYCITPRPMSCGLIRSLSLGDDEVFIITSRSECIRPGTREFVQRTYPDVKDVLFVDPGTMKTSTILDLGLDIWVDDCLTDIFGALSHAIDCVVADMPWNQTQVVIPRANSCLSIQTEINHIKKESTRHGKT